MKLLRRTVCVLAALLALASCGLARPEVAQIGDRELSSEELARTVALQQALADLRGGPCGQPVGDESAVSACNRAALSGELLWLAVVGYADANGIAPTTADVDRAVGQLETEVGGPGVLDRALRRRDVTRDDLFELGRRILTIREVRVAVAEDRVGNDELRARYRERVLEYTIVQVDHILLKTQAGARDVYDQVRDATEEEFIALARSVSIEPGAAEGGGELGSATASGYARPFAEAAVALEPGEVSEPVQTQFGWHVIYLVDKQVTPFEEAKAGLLEPLADEEFQAWLQQRAEELAIELNPRFGRFVSESFSVEPVRSTDPERDAGTEAPSPS